MLDFQAARFLVEGEVAAAGRQQSSDQHPDRRVQDRATATSTSPPPAARCGSGFADALDAEPLLHKPDYRTAAARSENRDALNADIESSSQSRTSAEWVDRLNEAGVPCGPIYSIDEVFADPQVEHLGMAQNVERQRQSASSAWSASRSRCRVRLQHLAARPPELGEHTDAVLKEFGFSREIAALHKAARVTRPHRGVRKQELSTR